METPNITTLIEGNKVTFKRYFDAPKSLVFEAWTAHDHLSHWWGPDGFTITTHHLDFSNGGTWSFIMHGPDGVDYINNIQFIEIKNPEFLHYKQKGEGDTDGIHFETKVFFMDAPGGCQLAIEMVFDTAEELEYVSKNFGAIEGGQQHLTRLGHYLKTLKGNM